MIPNCFAIYFNPIYLYVKRLILLGIDNDSIVARTTLIFSIGIEAFSQFLGENYIFGESNFIVLMVILTTMIDAYYGVKKSIKKGKENLNEAQKYPIDSPEYKMHIKVAKLKEFDPKKLQFTGFKCFTFLAYLFFANNVLTTTDDNGVVLIQVIAITSSVVIKAPLLLFWYYDFKSIGENSAYVYSKKAYIFTVVEKIFEPNIKRFFKKNEE